MNTQVINLVEQTILEKMRRRAGFTALDISNALKAERFPVRHKEVSEIVRDVFQSGAMAHYDYERELIYVVTEAGSQITQAFLYRYSESQASEYTTRDLDALPPVPDNQARDLSDCAAAGPLPILPRPPGARAARTPSGRRKPAQGRQDGALPIPRGLIESLGWKAGDKLALQAEQGRLVLRPAAKDTYGKAVKIWGGQRARICKMKLRLGALTADIATFDVDGDSLCVEAGDIKSD